MIAVVIRVKTELSRGVWKNLIWKKTNDKKA